MASIASPIGTARMPTHGSWRPLTETSVFVPFLSTVSRGVRIEEVGFTAKRATTGCPVEMPPRMPPALLDLNPGRSFGRVAPLFGPLFSRHSCGGEARADLHPLHGVDAHESAGDILV